MFANLNYFTWSPEIRVTQVALYFQNLSDIVLWCAAVIGRCDFDSDLCDGKVNGSWYRDVGLLVRKNNKDIKRDPLPGEAPLYDFTQPHTSKGLCFEDDQFKEL